MFFSLSLALYLLKRSTSVVSFKNDFPLRMDSKGDPGRGSRLTTPTGWLSLEPSWEVTRVFQPRTPDYLHDKGSRIVTHGTP